MKNSKYSVIFEKYNGLELEEFMFDIEISNNLNKSTHDSIIAEAINSVIKENSIYYKDFKVTGEYNNGSNR